MVLAREKRHNALSDTVYGNLRRRIVTGRLKAGQRVTEQQIAELEGISRAPVREALKRLDEDGLVTLVPRSGCYVRRLTPEEVNDIFEIRKRLESLALEYAFGRFDLNKIRTLRKRFQACLGLDEPKLARKELRLDGQLHSLICEASGSRNVQDLLGKLWARIQVFRAREAMAGGRARVALKGHIGILDAILAADKQKALRLLEEHIETARKYTLAASQ